MRANRDTTQRGRRSSADDVGRSDGTGGHAPQLDRRLLQEVNDRIAELAEWNETGVSLFLCECSDRECAEALEITTAEYARCRIDGRFVVFPGHEPSDPAHVVERNGRFVVVAKPEPAEAQPIGSGGRDDG